MSELPVDPYEGSDEEITPGAPTLGERISRWVRAHKLVPIALFIVAALVFLWARTGDHKQRVIIDQVVAGDRFIAQIDGKPVNIQLANVRTPGPETCYGKNALSALQTILRPGEQYEVLFDTSLDKDGSDLRYALVTVQERSLNAAVASTGLARVLREGKDIAFDDAAAASSGAQRAKVGLFDPSHACAGEDEEFVIDR